MPGETLRAYLLEQIESLEPFGFVALVPSGQPLHIVEIGRDGEGDFQVVVPGRPSIAPALPDEILQGLRDRGFACENESDRRHPWTRAVDDAPEALDLARSLMTDLFGAKPDQPTDVLHGSHEAEEKARLKLETVRVRLERLLTEMHGDVLPRDADGDYLLPIGDVRVTVAPRALPGGPLVVRIFAVCNVGIAVTPEVGLLLARLNFGLMFGRFALDAQNNAIWFDETLLGEEFTDEGLRFAVNVVASTADEWDDRLKQMFGGLTYQEVLSRGSGTETPPIKPGEGPGLYL